MKIIIDYNKCSASGECVRVCPEKAINFVNGKPTIDAAKCDLDGICIPACPNRAIKIEDVEEE